MAVNKKLVGGSAGAVGAIVAAIFAVEGGYVNDPLDPGGETNHGITLATAQAYGYTGKMKDLDLNTATNIYVTNYINKPGYVELITLSPAVGQKLVDAGVNAGTSRSSTWFQQGLNSLNRGGVDYAKITVDGKVGPASITAYSGLVKKRGKVKACEMILKLMDAQQTNHYTSLTNLSQYTPGWIDARIGNVPLEKCRE
uniref:Endonuclease n=1 Tax=Pseudomonas phage Arace01 TaxID=3138526 RepID=A0AAU6VZE0_9VIRU